MIDQSAEVHEAHRICDVNLDFLPIYKFLFLLDRVDIGGIATLSYQFSKELLTHIKCGDHLLPEVMRLLLIPSCSSMSPGVLP